jgi:NADPH:quinone reductase-like Zn-dependent oxidoreductase
MLGIEPTPATPGRVRRRVSSESGTACVGKSHSTQPQGVVCTTGAVGNVCSIDHFEPLTTIPKAARLTTYGGSAEDFVCTPMQKIIDDLSAGRLKVRIGKIFSIDEIVEAHRCMEENRAGGKIVVLTNL